MDGNSSSNSLKDYSIVCMRTSKDNNLKLQDSWASNSSYHEEDYFDGLSWPPRSYPCSFCKREFRSAQALGGHMNVHRRDRAKMRQSPPRDAQFPILNLNTDPNPSPSFSPPLACTIPSLVSPPLSALPSSSFSSPSKIKKWTLINGEIPAPLSPKASDLTKPRTMKSLFDAKEKYDGFAPQDARSISKTAEIRRLELKIGLVSDPNEDLDLELRLGYP